MTDRSTTPPVLEPGECNSARSAQTSRHKPTSAARSSAERSRRSPDCPRRDPALSIELAVEQIAERDRCCPSIARMEVPRTLVPRLMAPHPFTTGLRPDQADGGTRRGGGGHIRRAPHRIDGRPRSISPSTPVAASGASSDGSASSIDEASSRWRSGERPM